MYSRGMSAGIQATIKDIYNADISPEPANRVTDEIKELAGEWRNHPLEPFYPVIFFDVLRVNIYVPYKDRKAVTADLKEIYPAPSEDAADSALERFAEKRDVKYPAISKS
jgi:transposase-like protein